MAEGVKTLSLLKEVLPEKRPAKSEVEKAVNTPN